MAISLNGTTDFLSCANAVLTAYPGTLFCWFNPTNNAAAYYTGVVYNSGTELSGWRMRAAGDVANDPCRFATGDGVTNSAVSTSTFFATNTWQRMMFTLTNATARNGYFNNGGVTVDAVNITPGGLNRTYIGANRASGADSGFFPGQIAHWAAWNIVLSATDRAMLEAGWSPWNVQRQALVCYLPLWDTDYGATDMTGNFTFTPQGTPTYSAGPVGVRFFLGNSYKGGF